MFVVPSPVRVGIRPAGALLRLGARRARIARSTGAQRVTSAASANGTTRRVVNAAGGAVSLKADDVAANGEAGAVRGARLSSRVFDDRAVEVISAADATAIKNPAIVNRRRPEPTRPRATA
jgi:hypothetical protein